MKRERFYILLISLLLLLNVGIIIFIFILANRLPGKNEMPPRPDQIIIERLKLDDKQQMQFEELKHEHHEQMLHAQSVSTPLHQYLFHELQKQDRTSMQAQDSIYNLLAKNQLYKEKATFEHLQKLRNILRPEQEAAFNELVADISERIMGHHPPHP